MANEKSKEIKMDAQKGQKNEKLSYEQLEQVANNLNRQCQQLYNQLQEANRVIAGFNEIDMLLAILGKSEHFSEEFVTRCSAKIEEIVTEAMDNGEKQAEDSKA